MNETAAAQIKSIETAATSSFGRYNPVATVRCPHCGGSMAAMDAKSHVRTAAAR